MDQAEVKKSAKQISSQELDRTLETKEDQRLRAVKTTKNEEEAAAEAEEEAEADEDSDKEETLAWKNTDLLGTEKLVKEARLKFLCPLKAILFLASKTD